MIRHMAYTPRQYQECGRCTVKQRLIEIGKQASDRYPDLSSEMKVQASIKSDPLCSNNGCELPSTRKPYTAPVKIISLEDLAEIAKITIKEP
mgnify:CR=1 FL=1